MPKPTISPKLLDAGQRIMDVYYQDFNSNDDFFRLEDFCYWLSVVYGKTADEVAQAIYQNSRAEMGDGYITFSQDWWASKDFAVSDFEGEKAACLDIKYVGFTYDSQNSGIQIIQPLKSKCKNLIRTTLTDAWILQYTPAYGNDTAFWYLLNNKVIFPQNAPSAIRVFYIPTAEDENFKIPSSVEFDIATRAWNFMITAKKGTPLVDTTNDSNPDIAPQTELNLKQSQPVGS